ncbi:MAG: FHA domain-containing protein [Pyrinomonadaceae bacterium]
MTEQNKNTRGFSFDWLVGGILTKVGDTFDRITGRGWNPSSSLATSKLEEKLKFLLDEDAKDGELGGKFVPHVITLKIQWNKFAADSEDELEKLRTELHAAAVNHINDKLYHTFAPIQIDIKTDYFTEGVRLIGSFGEFGPEDDEAAVNVTLPSISIEDAGGVRRANVSLEESSGQAVSVEMPVYRLHSMVEGKVIDKELDFNIQKRFSIGRGAENDIVLSHASVSKAHAALAIKDGELIIADTGSTNGTFVEGGRIAYGKAMPVEGKSIRLGSIDAQIEVLRKALPVVEVEPTQIEVGVEPTALPQTEAFSAPVPVAAPEENSAQETVAFQDELTNIDPLDEIKPVTSNTSSDWADFGDSSEGSTPRDEREKSGQVEPHSRTKEDWEI